MENGKELEELNKEIETLIILQKENSKKKIDIREKISDIEYQFDINELKEEEEKRGKEWEIKAKYSLSKYKLELKKFSAVGETLKNELSRLKEIKREKSDIYISRTKAHNVDYSYKLAREFFEIAKEELEKEKFNSILEKGYENLKMQGFEPIVKGTR